jgi:hypothetical protein
MSKAEKEESETGHRWKNKKSREVHMGLLICVLKKVLILKEISQRTCANRGSLLYQILCRPV